MKTFNLAIIIFITLLMMSCEKKSDIVTNSKDYNAFLELNDNKSIDFAKNEIDFWQEKFDASPNQITYLSQIASNYSKLFEITGNIQYLVKAEELLLKSNEAFRYTQVGTIRSLARNYITQHRFKEALVLANKALEIGEGMKETQKLLFDVQMELGNYKEAEKWLKAIQSYTEFDFFIRLAKWNDHLGDLPTAISLMEKATKKAENSENKNLMVWSYSNLGDMYGHAGKIKDSYKYYLKTLALDPHNSYALKGIAWIAFSHEKNTKEANRIIDVLVKKHHSPDLYLLKAEIAEYENKNVEKEKNITNYFYMLQENDYGVMYNKYNALIFSDDKSTAKIALSIAEQEIKNRPTPDSYDLLAWAYYNLGAYKKAFEIAQKHVVGKSFEPELNYHLAMIYKANNKNSLIAPIKKDLLMSTFELGPTYTQKIEKL